MNDLHDDEVLSEFASETGLRYVRDDEPGFHRYRRGKGFEYRDATNTKVSNENILHRIESLVIPPAWDDVWICRFGNGHLQATGRDARERKQYRYHSLWSQARNETKFHKLTHFAEKLPRMRQQIEEDLQLPGLPRRKVLAAIVKTMELTKIRIGNEVYANENDSYGLTTILNKHAKIEGSRVKFRFRGKSGVLHEVGMQDPRLSKIIKRCQELPGEELFSYQGEDGEVHDVNSADVNAYIHEIGSDEISAKDFRTWGGTLKAVECLLDLGPCDEISQRGFKKREREVIQQVASHLGNTVAVCRKYYVHPKIFEADHEGALHKMTTRGPRGLLPSERLMLNLLASA